MLTTSYQAFKTLELLRSRCGLSARDSATHLMCVSESTYSMLRKALDEGRECALSAENDIGVRVGLRALVTALESSLLPATAADRKAAVEELGQIRSLLREQYASRPAVGIEQMEHLLSTEQLIGYAKIFMAV